MAGELGLSAARLRGMREAAGELLVFVDDDNVLDTEYLSQAVRIGHEWPLLGVWGSGVIAPEFEREPAEHLKQYLFYLALRDTTVPRWSNVFPCLDATPWGAGLCLRKVVASNYCQIWDESHIRLSDRVGRSLMSGGDMEIACVACSMGLGMGVFPVLRLTHLIPQERVTADYLVRMAEASTTSNYLLACKWQNILPPDPFSPLGLLSVFKNLVVNRGMQRRMYLSDLRARIAALRIIGGSRVQG
jgi:glycosyltransferase involved in cell wall biosynthesis